MAIRRNVSDSRPRSDEVSTPRVAAARSRLARAWAVPAAGACFVAAVVLAASRIATVSRGTLRVTESWAFADFRTAVHFPVKAFLEGHNPYVAGKYLEAFPSAPEAFPSYLPITLLLHAPFGLASAEVAAFGYAGFLLGLTVVLAWTILRVTGIPPTAARVLVLASLILVTRPGQGTLLLGQVTLQAVLASIAAVFFSRRAPLVSGLALAVAFFKPTFGIPLSLLLVATGRCRAAAIGVAIAAISNLPIVAWFAWRSGGIVTLVEEILAGARTFEKAPDTSAAVSIYRLDLPALVGRFSGVSPSGLESLALGAAVLALAVIVLRRVPADVDAIDVMSVAFPAVLLSTYHQYYDLLLLAVPFAALCRGRTDVAGSVRLLALGSYAALAFNYLAAKSVTSALPEAGLAWLVVTSFNGALLVGLFGLGCARILFVSSQGRRF